ncbi:MAG TPA: alpha/beta fold hydrolase [Niastella sp.]
MQKHLICLPFAGGTKYSMKFPAQYLSPDITLHAFDYPGHGGRLKEKMLEDLTQMAEDIFEQCKHLLHHSCAIYGHSMGALVAYLLTRKIVESGARPPIHLFVSGSDGPSIPYQGALRSGLPKPDFIKELKRLGGMPQEILNDDRIMDFFEPIIRTDFRAVENYQYLAGSGLQVPITVMLGAQEKITMEAAYTWQQESVFPVQVKVFEGDHFFIYKQQQSIAAIINDAFETCLV